MKHTFFLLFVVVLGVSCVPNRKMVYLQNDNELNKRSPKDTVLRTYDLANYEYRIQPEDILSIRFQSLTDTEFDIFNEQDLVRGSVSRDMLLVSGYLVDRDGMIEFSELGEVQVAGLTLHEVREKLQGLAEDYITEPVVNVRLLNFRVTVLGEVNKEGTITTYNNKTTMMEAIGLAGGLTDLADRKEVKVIRQRGGQTEVLYVNLLEESYMADPSFFVHQNDIIIVAPLKQRPFRKYFAQNVGLFLSSVSTLLLIVNFINSN